jgi:hypothetical protein
MGAIVRAARAQQTKERVKLIMRFLAALRVGQHAREEKVYTGEA